MMSARLLTKRIASRALWSATTTTAASRHSVVFCAPVASATRFFSAAEPSSESTEEEEKEETKQPEVVVPGVGKGKTSTGYTGLAVEPDWYNVMLKKFQALLDRMEASDMPETAQYRIDVTKWCNFVIKTAKANPDDPEAVEDAVGMGQVEELIEMADDEMIAMDTYLRVRMWELVEQMNPDVDFNPDPMKDPFAGDADPEVAEKLREGMEAQKEQKKE